MTIAIACVLVAGLLPYVWIGYAKLVGRAFNNRAPRMALAKLEGAPARAHWAHLNAFEAFPFFAAAVILAMFRGVDQTTVDNVALVFVVARLLHGSFYLLDWAALRSLAWFVGLACPIILLCYAI